MHGFMKAPSETHTASAIITAFIIIIIIMEMMIKYDDDNAEVKTPTVPMLKP